MAETIASVLHHSKLNTKFLDELHFDNVDVMVIDERERKVNGNAVQDEEDIIEQVKHLKNGICKASNGKYVYTSKAITPHTVIAYSKI